MVAWPSGLRRCLKHQSLRRRGFESHRCHRNISLLKIRRRQTSVTARGSEITARKTSGCRRCEVSRRSGLVCDVKKAILPSRVRRE